ncbi:MAG: hypothetical protein U9O56_01510 [Campylobacterota bacterium]|nr:hypothetical protein [Campylobacterota bacterium]
MKKQIKLFTTIALLSAKLYASSTGSCWSLQDKADLEFYELQNIIKFSFKDAKTCEPISNADLFFLGEIKKIDNNGELSLPIPPKNIDAKFNLVVKKPGYITLNQKVQASVGSFWQNKFLMTKELPIKSARFVLGWGDSPKDLDLHLVSDDFHISYRNKNGSTHKVSLDRDSRKGFGPETITLNHLEYSKKYKVYIYRYSSKGNVNHNTNLSLYKNNKLDNVITMPDNLTKKCIEVATIYKNSVDYHIKEVNRKNCN